MYKKVVLVFLVGIILFFSLVLGVGAEVCTDGPSESCPVILYEGDDFDPEESKIGFIEGEIDRLTLYRDSGLDSGAEVDNGRWNDQVSSYRIYQGYMALFYEHDHFQGESLLDSAENTEAHRYKLTDVSLGTDTWNNAISSLKIISLSSVGGAFGENTAADCNDEIDNDEDVNTDCADPECAGFFGSSGSKCCQAVADCGGAGQGAICTNEHECQENDCVDNEDNDGDGPRKFASLTKN